MDLENLKTKEVDRFTNDQWAAWVIHGDPQFRPATTDWWIKSLHQRILAMLLQRDKQRAKVTE